MAGGAKWWWKPIASHIFDVQWRELVNVGGTWLELLIDKMTTPLICVIALWQIFQILQLKIFIANH